MRRDTGYATNNSIVYVVDDDESMRIAVATLLRSVDLRAELFESANEFFAFRMLDVPS
jgi:FixJ family two-component response regulator